MSVAIRDGGADDAPGASRLLASAARAASRGEDAVKNLLTDFFLPASTRATDRDRATMARLLDQLVGDIEDDLRAALVPAFEDAWPNAAAALASARVPIARPILEQSGLLRDSMLIDFLQARAASYRLLVALRRIAQPQIETSALATSWPNDADIVEGDQALMLAEARRTDAAHEAAIDQRDLPADLLHRVVWRVAAALRGYLVGLQSVPAGVADRAVAAAARALLAAHDEGDTIDARAARLALILSERIQADDESLLDVLRRGRVELFAAMLGLRCGLEMSVALSIVRDPTIDRLAVSLKAASVQREVATTILFEMAAINGLSESGLIQCIDDFSLLEPSAAQEAIEPWRLDEDYRAAVAALVGSIGA